MMDSVGLFNVIGTPVLIRFGIPTLAVTGDLPKQRSGQGRTM